MEKNITSAEDLKTIRKIMEESTRFLSLSGLSGIFAGTCAIAGSFAAWLILPGKQLSNAAAGFASLSSSESSDIVVKMIIIASAVLLLSVISSLFFSLRKAKRAGRKIWTPVSKRLVVSLLIPLLTGGLFVIIMLIQKQYSLIIPGFLIFYGLSLVNAGKFTYGEVFYLGILELLTGILCLLFPGLGLIFWTIGFGLLHVAYGLFMYRKYEA